MSTAQVTEIRPGVREAGQIINVKHQENQWRQGVVGHVQKSVPAFRHEQSVPVSQIPPLDNEIVRETGAVLNDGNEDTLIPFNITGADIRHGIGSGSEQLTGVKRWMRWIKGKFGKRLTETRRGQLEQARKSNQYKGDYEDMVA